MEVLPIRAATKTVRWDLGWLVIQLANGLTKRTELLCLVFDPGTLNQLKARDLILDEAHAFGQQSAGRVFDNKSCVMEPSTRRVCPQ
jgi:hypothetical protein